MTATLARLRPVPALAPGAAFDRAPVLPQT
jgi:hypothetical protein